MTLHPPFIISARLMPAVQIGGATLSLGYGRHTSEGRMQYDIWIDLPDKSEHHITDLRSGCQGGSIVGGMASLLSFLGASADSYAYRMRTGDTGENEDLFAPVIVEWAYQNSDELSMLQMDIEESETTLVDEDSK